MHWLNVRSAVAVYKWTAIKTDAAEQADGLSSLPDGQISGEPVQPFSQKYSASRFAQITSKTPAIPSHSEGRFAIVTDVGRDAVDAGCATDERAGPADGEGVWS
jgi:hypothetical protein